MPDLKDQALVILQAGGHGKVDRTMKCERCKTVVTEGEQRALHGQILCEDCYMEKIRGELRGGKKLIRLW